MTLSTHAAAGIMIAEWTGNPLLGFLIAIMSHYLLDMVPHGDEFVYWRYIHNKDDRIAKTAGTVDILVLSLMLTLLLTYGDDFHGSLTLLGALGGTLPDLLINIDSVLRRHPPKSRVGRAGEWLIKKHYTMHMFFHQLLFIPVRYRMALFLQLIAITLFLTFAI
ncbi:MAG: hypothetical protein KIH62_003970 [Candidatus Kerfeldbacteria bacterium]|nr:hypothetical protein [Candidatus Kerfeldbacteria bacterium]